MNAYVLAGGQSRRMGERKDQLVIADRTFLDRVLEPASQVFDEVVVVTRRELPVQSSRARVIVEREHDDTSPLFGMERAFEDAGHAPVWILGVDYPMMTADLLLYLRGRFETEGVEMLVPEWDGRPQLLCAGMGSSASRAVLGKIESGDLRLRGLIDAVSSLLLSEADLRERFSGEPLRNVNTPDDLERVRALLPVGQPGNRIC